MLLAEKRIFVKKFNNVKHEPLLKNIPEDTQILKISAPPSLHLLFGIFNHIWKNMESVSQEVKFFLHEFALKKIALKNHIGAIYLKGMGKYLLSIYLILLHQTYKLILQH